MEVVLTICGDMAPSRSHVANAGSLPGPAVMLFFSILICRRHSTSICRKVIGLRTDVLEATEDVGAKGVVNCFKKSRPNLAL